MRLAPGARAVAWIVAAALFMQALDASIIATSLPAMAGTFGVRPLDLGPGLTVYLLATAAFVPASGWVGERWGARRVFLVAIALFTLASLACGLSRTLAQFLLARAAQGVGGALMVPVGRLIVLRATERAQLVHAVAVLTWPSLAAPILGPVAGGFITTGIGWRWNFLLNVPLGIVGALLAARHFPPGRAERPAPLDLPGLALSAGALALLLYGLGRAAHDPLAWQAAFAPALAGAVLAAVAVAHLRRARHPLLDLATLRVRSFALCTIDAGLVVRAAINATPFLLPLCYQLAWGLEAGPAGLLLMAYFAGNMGMKPFTTRTLRRFGFRRLLVANGLLVGASIAALGLCGPGTAWALLLPLLVAAGAVRSMQFTCLNTLVFADVPDALRAPANTLSAMMGEVGNATGVAVGALLLAAAMALAGRAHPGPGQFALALGVVGAVAALAALRFAVLPREAGAAVSGQRR